MSHQVTVNFSNQAYSTLEKLSARRGQPIAEVLREAIALMQWYDTERVNGNKILVETPDHKYRELISI